MYQKNMNSSFQEVIDAELVKGSYLSDIKKGMSGGIEGIKFNKYPCGPEFLNRPLMVCEALVTYVASFEAGKTGFVCNRPIVLIDLVFDKSHRLLYFKQKEAYTCL